MDILRTTPEQLRTQAGKLQTQGEQIGGFVEKMVSLVESIGAATWSGDAADKYKNQFGELNDDGKRMKELLNDVCEKLQQIAETYQNAEEQNASIASSLPTDVF